MGAARTSSPAWACVFFVCGLSSAARASDTAYRLQLVRAEGAGSCADSAALERDVAQRLGRNPFSEAAERGIEVVLERADDKWRARLYLRIDETHTDQARVIESDSPECTELGKAVALAVALAIAPGLPPAAAPALPPAPAAPSCPPPPPTPAPKRSLHGAASVRSVFSPNLLPASSFGAAVSVSFRDELVGANIGALFYPEAKLHSADTRLGFGLSAGFASACLWPRTKEPQLWSCIGTQLGALHSVVYAPEPQHPGDRIWWAASSELGVRQTLVQRLFLEAGVAAIFPFVRHRFAVSSESSAGTDAAAPKIAYEQRRAVVEGFLGLGLRLD